MKFSTTINIIASAVAVSATPIEKRQVGGVLLCTGPNSTGTCKYAVYELNKCQQLEAPFLQNTTTFAVDGEDFTCSPRVTGCSDICKSPTGCTFGNVDFNYEHKYDLSAIQWNTLIKSFDCTMKTKQT